MARNRHDFHRSAPDDAMYQGRIYIAEEEKDLQGRLERVLTQNGFDVTVFNSGYPIVAMMDNWPDVFLIDIELPGINGLEVCKWLKSHESSSNIPVIFLSGDSYLKVLAASAHADDYIEKPVAWRQLINKILAYLPAETIK
jgi:DNA-binding response OmpR family regulator